MVKSLPTNAGDMGLTPDLGGSHPLQSNRASATTTIEPVL